MARPKLGDSDTERLHMKITKDELQAIEDWRYANRVPSKSEAIRRLIQIGLEVDKWVGSAVELSVQTMIHYEEMRFAITRFEATSEDDAGEMMEKIKAESYEIGAGLLALNIDGAFTRSFVRQMKGGKNMQEAIASARREQEKIAADLHELFEGGDGSSLLKAFEEGKE